MVRIELYDLLGKTQEYIAKYYATALTDEQKHDQLKAYIEKYILDGGFLVHGFTEDKLIDRLYAEMVEYSILTPFLGAADLDEININAWDDITLTYSDGRMVKLEEHFRSPSHAIDIVKRLLHHSGMIIDNATPIAQNNYDGNKFIIKGEFEKLNTPSPYLQNLLTRSGVPQEVLSNFTRKEMTVTA